jgi:hypothetical protein
VLYYKAGGAEGSRTPDLLIANEALYQLSYDPSHRAKVSKERRGKSSALDDSMEFHQPVSQTVSFIRIVFGTNIRLGFLAEIWRLIEV